MRLMHSVVTLPLLAAGALLALSLSGTGGQAQAACHPQTFHDERAESGVCCFTDHFHTGSSSGVASRAKAVTDAVRAWEDFVYFEYGGSYDHWSMAHGKSVSCSSSNGWSCTVEARACHRD